MPFFTISLLGRFRLQETEQRLNEITENQGKDANVFVELVKENRRIIDTMKVRKGETLLQGYAFCFLTVIFNLVCSDETQGYSNARLGGSHPC